MAREIKDKLSPILLNKFHKLCCSRSLFEAPLLKQQNFEHKLYRKEEFQSLIRRESYQD